MSQIIRGLLVVAVLGGFVAVYTWANGWGGVGRKPEPTPGAQAMKRGNYGHYTYAIERNGDENKIMVQFDPSLPADDSVVLPAFKAVSNDAFGIMLAEDVQPIVETRNDTNYITFAGGQKRVWIELFRNSGGKVGSARMWTEAQ